MMTPRELFKLALDSDSWFETRLELNKLRDLSYDLIYSYYVDFCNEVRKYQIEEADRRNKERLKDYYFASMFDEKEEGNIPRTRSELYKMLKDGLVFPGWDLFEKINFSEVFFKFTDYREVFMSILVENIRKALREMVDEAKNKEFLFDTDSDTSTAPDISPELQNYLDRLIPFGLAKVENNNYEWKGTLPELAFCADIISEKLKIQTKWKTFETLFHKKNLAQARNKAVNQRGKFSNREKEIRNLLED